MLHRHNRLNTASTAHDTPSVHDAGPEHVHIVHVYTPATDGGGSGKAGTSPPATVVGVPSSVKLQMAMTPLMRLAAASYAKAASSAESNVPSHSLQLCSRRITRVKYASDRHHILPAQHSMTGHSSSLWGAGHRAKAHPAAPTQHWQSCLATG